MHTALQRRLLTPETVFTKGGNITLAATGVVGIWGWIGVVPLLTGLIRWCPAYPLLGINSCPMRKGN